MAERLLNPRTTYGWLCVLAAITVLRPGEAGATELTSWVNFPVALVDLRRARVLSMSSPFAELLELDADSEEIDLHLLVERNERLDTLLELVNDGSIDAYQAHRRLRIASGGVVEVDSWLAAWAREEWSRALWVIVPADGRSTEAIPKVAADDWPQHVPGLIVGTMDSSWRVQRVSHEIESTVGEPIANLVNRPLIEVIHVDDLPRAFGALGRALAQHSAVAFEVRLRGRSTRWHKAHVIVTAIAGESLTYGFVIALATRDQQSASARVSRLEQHLWQIARELQASGVVDFGRRANPSDIPGLAELSVRQWEVVTRLARGQRVPTIAQELYVSQSTVRNHLTEIFRKVGVGSQAELLQLLLSSE